MPPAPSMREPRKGPSLSPGKDGVCLRDRAACNSAPCYSRMRGLARDVKFQPWPSDRNPHVKLEECPRAGRNYLVFACSNCGYTKVSASVAGERLKTILPQAVLPRRIWTVCHHLSKFDVHAAPTHLCQRARNGTRPFMRYIWRSPTEP